MMFLYLFNQKEKNICCSVPKGNQLCTFLLKISISCSLQPRFCLNISVCSHIDGFCSSVGSGLLNCYQVLHERGEPMCQYGELWQENQLLPLGWKTKPNKNCIELDHIRHLKSWLTCTMLQTLHSTLAKVTSN